MRQSISNLDDDYNIFNKKKINDNTDMSSPSLNLAFENSRFKSNLKTTPKNERLQNAQKILDTHKEKMERSSNFGSSIGFLSFKNSLPNNNLLKMDSSLNFMSPISQHTNRIDEIGLIDDVESKRKNTDDKKLLQSIKIPNKSNDILNSNFLYFNKKKVNEEDKNDIEDKQEKQEKVDKESINIPEVNRESKLSEEDNKDNVKLDIFNTIISKGGEIDKSIIKQFLLR